MTQTHQLDIFGGEQAHDLVVQEQKEQAYRERVRMDPEFARRSLILGCLNRRGPLPEYRICELLGMATCDVGMHIANLRGKGLVEQSGHEQDLNGHEVWVWRAMSKREE